MYQNNNSELGMGISCGNQTKQDYLFNNIHSCKRSNNSKKFLLVSKIANVTNCHKKRRRRFTTSCRAGSLRGDNAGITGQEGSSRYQHQRAGEGCEEGGGVEEVGVGRRETEKWRGWRCSLAMARRKNRPI